jgi:hypothetical protein
MPTAAAVTTAIRSMDGAGGAGSLGGATLDARHVGARDGKRAQPARRHRHQRRGRSRDAVRQRRHARGRPVDDAGGRLVERHLRRKARRASSGWASGEYLIAADLYTPSICGGSDDGGVSSSDGGAADIFARAKLAVGYSYYWGHGSWRDDGSDVGSCSGSCPSCTHSGAYGADCSGFVAKVWQVPSASPDDLDAHPFSTDDFYNDQTYWTQIPRSTLQPADALVYRSGSEGHIALYEGGSDPFGAVWLYEARGCATGVVHDLRTLDSAYIAIRRN